MPKGIKHCMEAKVLINILLLVKSDISWDRNLALCFHFPQKTVKKPLINKTFCIAGNMTTALFPWLKASLSTQSTFPFLSKI